MFDKFLKGAKSLGAGIKKASDEAGLTERLGAMANDPTLPLSGLIKGGQRSAPPPRPELVRHEDSLPKASVRDPELEDRLLAAATGLAEFGDCELLRCVLPGGAWVQVQDHNPPGGGGPVMKGRQRSSYLLGRESTGRYVVRLVTWFEACSGEVDLARLQEDNLFSGTLELQDLDRRITVVPESAAGAEIQLRRKVEVSPVLIQNSLDVRIKVQSSNSETGDYEDLLIPPRSEKTFTYFCAGDGFFIREAESSRLLLSLDPQEPGFGFKPIRV